VRLRIADLTVLLALARTREHSPRAKAALIATNRDDLAEALDDLAVMRRGHGSALRHRPCPATRRTSAMSLVDALWQLTRSSTTRKFGRRHVAMYGERPRGLSARRLAGCALATTAICSANHLYVVARDLSPTVTRCKRAPDRRGTSARRSTFSPCTSSAPTGRPARANQPALPVTERAGAVGAVATRSHRRTRTKTYAMAIAAFRRVHARWGGNADGFNRAPMEPPWLQRRALDPLRGSSSRGAPCLHPAQDRPRETWDILRGSASPWWIGLLRSDPDHGPPMAWRWQLLLAAARGARNASSG